MVDRQSVFREVGLNAPASTTSIKRTNTGRDRPQSVRFRSQDEVYLVHRYEDANIDATNPNDTINSATNMASPLPSSGSVMYRFGATVLMLAAALPLMRTNALFGGSAILPVQPVAGGPIPHDAASRTGPDLSKRSDSPTDVCFRWAQQSSLVNGTLYLYGGESSTEPTQTENLWNNDFLMLDLTQTWQIASPSLTGLSQPSGPPAVALGYLWNSYDSLYLYGGEFSWKPVTTPTAFSMWEYDIASQSWVEHSDPTTSEGVSAPDDGQDVERAAEGAGVSIPSLGRGYYFGGHEDGYTTNGWSQSVPRIYLQSLLEFTYPGYTNDQVNTLSGGTTAGTAGNYRNITEGGLQSSAGFTQRADGLLIYVPGFGAEGILLALAGGTNETFTQMNNINVYDIANSTWYTQSTSGETPNIRVNPCAVAASAPDGSSTNIYMFGGQNLIPAGNQTEYNDMWILTLPAFTWIKVDQSDQSVPYGRSGHTCNIWDGQMVMVGGYVGDQLSCESPGIYVFDLSNVQWVQQFTALSSGSSSSSSSSSSSDSGSDSSPSSDSNSGISTGTNTASSSTSTSSLSAKQNPLNQQPAQLANASYPGGLQGSYGYTVPKIIIDVIGGGPSGGATITKPVVTASAGPLATGKAITYTVTNAGGSTATETASANSGNGGGNGDNGNSNGGGGGPNIAAIVVGVICGLLAILAGYLAFCAWVYRRQLQLYKRHVEMSQRQARGEKVPAIPGLLATDSSGKNSSERKDGGSSMAATGSSGPSSGPGYQKARRESEGSTTDEELLGRNEPSFVGVMLNPRRSLRVINRD